MIPARTHFLVVAATALFWTGCGGMELRLAKGTVEDDKPVKIFATLAAGSGMKVNFKITSGKECGTLDSDQAATVDSGVASVAFKATPDVEDCAVTITADSSNGKTARLAFFVNKQPLTKTRIDGVSILVLFLIASFLVDRLARALLFGLGFFPFARFTGDKSDRNQKVAYFVIASGLAVAVLSWGGNIRMLAALGFAQVHPILDTLFTGLLLVAGADRTEALLSAMGAGGSADGGAQHPAGPVEIKGEIVVMDRQPK